MVTDSLPEDIFQSSAVPVGRRGVVDVALDRLNGRPGSYVISNDLGISRQQWGERARRRGWIFAQRNGSMFIIVPTEADPCDR